MPCVMSFLLTAQSISTASQVWEGFPANPAKSCYSAPKSSLHVSRKIVHTHHHPPCPTAAMSNFQLRCCVFALWGGDVGTGLFQAVSNVTLGALSLTQGELTSRPALQGSLSMSSPTRVSGRMVGHGN